MPSQCYSCGRVVAEGLLQRGTGAVCHPCLAALTRESDVLPPLVPGGKALKFTATKRIRVKPPPEKPRRTAWERLSGPDLV